MFRGNRVQPVDGGHNEPHDDAAFKTTAFGNSDDFEQHNDDKVKILLFAK